MTLEHSVWDETSLLQEGGKSKTARLHIAPNLIFFREITRTQRNLSSPAESGVRQELTSNLLGRSLHYLVSGRTSSQGQ